MMRQRGVQHVTVIDERGHVVGMVTSRALRRAVFGPPAQNSQAALPDRLRRGP
jgi:CBS domain-containing protein